MSTISNSVPTNMVVQENCTRVRDGGFCPTGSPFSPVKQRRKAMSNARHRAKKYAQDPNWKKRDSARYRMLHPDRSRRSNRTNHLKRTYGLSLARFNEMMTKQNGKCAICKAAPPTHVDHCHNSKKVRGLLCINCNIGLGQFKDNTATLQSAILYLQ